MCNARSVTQRASGGRVDQAAVLLVSTLGGTIAGLRKRWNERSRVTVTYLQSVCRFGFGAHTHDPLDHADRMVPCAVDYDDSLDDAFRISNLTYQERRTNVTIPFRRTLPDSLFIDGQS